MRPDIRDRVWVSIRDPHCPRGHDSDLDSGRGIILIRQQPTEHVVRGTGETSAHPL